MFVRKIAIKNPLSEKPRKGAVICLPGLGVPAFLMLKFARQMELRRTTLVTLEPYKLQWYPRPKGAHDQAQTIKGLPFAVASAQTAVEQVKKALDLTNDQIVVMGFSAGAVVALQLGMQADEPFAATVALAGAVFEPDKVKPAKNDMPIILQHNKDDDCFDWWERYLPMRNALQQKGYNLNLMERPFGPHTLYVNDAVNVSRVIAPLLGYPKGFAKKYLDPKCQK